MPLICECGKRACFNVEGEKTPKWCATCIKNKGIKNAIDVVHKLCPCGKRPTYNVEGETTGRWCFTCIDKPENAIDVVNKKCPCGKIPNYNLESETTGKWCLTCIDRPENAIDVVNKKCPCGKRPSYNVEGETTGRWCVICKPENAIDVIHKKCSCGKIPNYNLEGETVGKWCAICKPINAIDVISKKCKECKSTQISNPNYNGYCVRCFIHLFPDEPVSRNYKVKEKHVFDAIIPYLPPDLFISRDKIVGGCSKRRPDLMIDLGSHWICAENDEDSHQNYDTTCENKRIMELYTDMGNRPMIVIRFNCDKYMKKDNTKVESLFKICKQTGISLIRNKKKFDERIKVFSNVIKKYLTEIPERAITYEYLYYDNYD